MKHQQRKTARHTRDEADQVETRRLTERFSADEERRHRRRLLYGESDDESSGTR